MYKQNTHLIFSPSDLVTFSISEYASWMDRYLIECPDLAPAVDASDSFSQLLAAKGQEHEKSLFERFKTQGYQIVDISLVSGLADKQAATLDAMKSGADIIYQAALEHNPFRGFADFLLKTPNQAKQKSTWGKYHYQVMDSKLSRSVKSTFILQLCCYADMLEQIQGLRPEQLMIGLGNGQTEIVTTLEYFDQYLSIKKAFLNFQQHWKPEAIPNPADYQNYGRWSQHAENLLIERDHLSLIANIRRAQIKKLQDAQIFTCNDLIFSPLTEAPGIKSSHFLRLQSQARIQQQSADKRPPLFELLDDQSAGLELLPAHSLQDVFFDIEGFPLIDGGLEYLWGNCYFDCHNQRQYKDFWAHDAMQEKTAFESFIEWVYERWLLDPEMHIYHYASYEITACKKILKRHEIGGEKFNQLIDNQVFIDLYKIVKNSLLLGEPRYSIKNVEKLYRAERTTVVTNGGDSVVAYELWRKDFAAGNATNDWQTSDALKYIRDYNIDDCNSTQELTEWLRKRQNENKIIYRSKLSKQ